MFPNQTFQGICKIVENNLLSFCLRVNMYYFDHHASKWSQLKKAQQSFHNQNPGDPGKSFLSLSGSEIIFLCQGVLKEEKVRKRWTTLTTLAHIGPDWPTLTALAAMLDPIFCIGYHFGPHWLPRWATFAHIHTHGLCWLPHWTTLTPFTT